MIKALIFDLGNVLIYFDWKISENRLNKIKHGLGNLTTKFFKENNLIIKDLEKGKLSENNFLDTIKSHIDSNIDRITLAKIFSEIFSENIVLTKLLPELKRNYKLFLLSNTNIIHRKFGWGHYEFLKHFDKLFLSYEIGAVKPEEEIYNYVIQSIDLNPDEVLYIDDIEEYVNVAKKLGWNATQFKTNEKLIEEFESFGLKITF